MTSHRKFPVLFGGLVYFIVVGFLFVCYFFNIKENYYFCLQKFAVRAQVKRRQTEEPKRSCKKIQVLKVVAIAVSADFDLVYLTPNLKRRGNRANFA